MSGRRPEPLTAWTPGAGKVVVSVTGAGKRYLIYDRPAHRLWQGLFRGRRQFFREFWALRDVSFEVRRGEVVGVIGANGSGKSTLLQLICGTLEPTLGATRVQGRVAALLELGTGFNPDFTGRENVYVNAAVLGLSRSVIDARFDRIAGFADIGAFIDQPVKTYSSGMYVRLAFAVIAHVDADVLVIDEALAVGDAVFAQKCMRFLRQFREHGAILFVSHDTAAVLNLCSRVLWLDRGSCVRIGAPKDVVEAYMRAASEAVRGADEPPAWDPVRDVAQASVERSFGVGGAAVQSTTLHGPDDEPRPFFRGGEGVTLRVVIVARQDIDSAIVGFHVKDRLGQVLFGENTCDATLASPVALRQGESAVAEFRFTLPLLRTGTYSLDVAIADGTQAVHVQHHWVFDALVFEVLTESPVFGVMGVPGTHVRLTVGGRTDRVLREG